MTEPVLSIRNLSVVLSRDGRSNRVLDGISFDAAHGEIIALVGESGSGKSTIGLALQGLLPRESQPQVSGSICLDGTEIVGASQKLLRGARRSLVRAVSQDPMSALDPTMTIARQMQESIDGPAPITDWLKRTGLHDPERIAASFPHLLSGGQRQRVLIAMAMMASPKLLIADEPTTALDVTIQAQILDLLRTLAREQQTAIVFVTHDLSVAASLADRVIVLYAGRIAEIGAIRNVIANPAHPYTAGLLSARFDFSSDRSRPLATLPIERGQRVDTGSACAYSWRCPLADGECRTVRPSLRSIDQHDGSTACHHPARTPLASRRDVAAPWPRPDILPTGVALELFNVSKSFASGTGPLWGKRQEKRVLQSVNLSIRRGECVALVGESGSGKSTILRIAAGLLAPSSGDVSRVDNVPPQVVFQDAVSALTPWLTIGEQIGERLRPLRLSAGERRERVGAALTMVGLDPALMTALPSELSGGQCQRAMVARAVVVPPKLLLCDEPISAMDVSLAATTLNLLGDLRRRLGMAMMFVTHDLAAARIIADRIAVLQNGELVEVGDVDAVIAAPQAAYTRRLIAAMPTLHLEPAHD
ncbi:MAG TPA: ABC transporter ATP-binding protein [Ensifer sp.]|nr:ABC transporter ATP-binding protein [Ensifer sp.]